jgi:hypothetical protein
MVVCHFVPVISRVNTETEHHTFHVEKRTHVVPLKTFFPIQLSGLGSLSLSEAITAT